jgi:alkylation response protein AidB-like acyl-CoA dehydrogenase
VAFRLGGGVAGRAILTLMAADVALTDDHRQLRHLVRDIARERIAPLAAEVDETDTYPARPLEGLGAQGIMGALPATLR